MSVKFPDPSQEPVAYWWEYIGVMSDVAAAAALGDDDEEYERAMGALADVCKRYDDAVNDAELKELFLRYVDPADPDVK